MSVAGQVEQKRLGIPRNVPAAVQQWEGLIAINYAARAAGITRHMRVHEARALCPELKLMHVETIGESCSFPLGMHQNLISPARSSERTIPKIAC